MADCVWVLDVDGTLMNNIHDYSKPILDSTQLIIDALGDHAPDVVSIVNLQDEIDKKMSQEINPDTGRPYIFNMDRFPRSRVRTYEQLCHRVNVAIDPEIRGELLAIGYQAFDESRYEGNVYPDAASLTVFLRDQGDRVILLTRGDPRVQERKIYALGQRGVVFDNAIIVEHDKREDFLSLRSLAPIAFSVGDSYDSDISRALPLGYRCIWKPVYNWEQREVMDQLRTKAAKEGVMVIRSLSDIVERYRDISSK